MSDKPEQIRCPWPGKDQLMIDYHDKEWGIASRDDRKLFEMLVLETAQAGLSWRVVLHKREGYRRLFHQFDPTLVAQMTQDDVERLVLDPAIIRNRAKIKATISNAQAFLQIAQKHGSFANWQWQFTHGKTVHLWKDLNQVTPTTELSDRIAKELKQLGMKFMGSTVVYAHLQACGQVNDHLKDCYRYAELVAA